jgi:hypothetical protein
MKKFQIATHDGIFHPDDMSGIILDSFWRHLHSQPIKLEEQTAYYQEYWKVHSEPKKKACPMDGSSIELEMSLDESEGKKMRAIHVGRCLKRKHLGPTSTTKVGTGQMSNCDGRLRPEAEIAE